MKITAVAPNYSTPPGRKEPTKIENDNSQITAESMASDSSKLNLHDVSISEINTLIKAGTIEVLDVLPFIPPHVLEQYNYEPELVGKHRVNLLGQLEQSIDFKKSIGENTTMLEEVLANLSKLDGSYLPIQVNELV